MATNPSAGLAAQGQRGLVTVPVFLAGDQLPQLHRHEQCVPAHRIHLPTQHRRNFHLHRPPVRGHRGLPAPGEHLQELFNKKMLFKFTFPSTSWLCLSNRAGKPCPGFNPDMCFLSTGSFSMCFSKSFDRGKAGCLWIMSNVN